MGTRYAKLRASRDAAKAADRHAVPLKKPSEYRADFVGLGAVVFCNDRHGRDEWSGHIITSETPGLWITGHHKINKKTMIEANGRGRGEPLKWYSREDKNDMEWRAKHEHRIRESIRGCSMTQLQEIARIVGYGIEDK